MDALTHEALRQILGGLEDSLAKQGQGLRAVQADVQAVRGEVQAVKGEMQVVKSEVMAVKTRVTSTKTDVVALGKHAEASEKILIERVDRVQGKVRGARGEFKAVRVDIKGTLYRQRTALLATTLPSILSFPQP
jgi:DNA-binding FrmR family transcriptional regulator